MMSAIQEAYYQRPKNPSLLTVLTECAAETGLNIDRFRQDMASAELDKELQAQNTPARNLGVRTFPSLRLRQGRRLSIVPIDYNQRGILPFLPGRPN